METPSSPIPDLLLRFTEVRTAAFSVIKRFVFLIIYAFELTAGGIANILDAIEGQIKAFYYIAQIPGPPLYTSLRLALSPKNERFNQVYSMIDKYAHHGIVKFWAGPRPYVVITRAEAAEAFLKGAKEVYKGVDYIKLKTALGNGLFVSGGTEGKIRRKMLNPAFRTQLLDKMSPLVNRKADVLVDILQKTDRDQYLDIYKYCHTYAMDCVYEAILGVEADFQRCDKHDIMALVDSNTETVVERSINPWLQSDFIFNRTKLGKKFNAAVKIVQQHLNQVIEIKRKSIAAKLQSGNEGTETEKNEDVPSFLEFLLHLAEEEGTLTPKDILDELFLFIIAGHDSTTISLSAALYHLGNHPEWQEKIQKEIDEILGNSERSITRHDLAKMTALNLSIKESLRVSGPGPWFFRRSPNNVKVGDYTVPAWINVIVAIIFIHYDPEIYAEPTKFDPERYLPENCRNRHPYASMPFAIGFRSCIASQLGMMEIGIAVAHVLRRFNIVSRCPMDQLSRRLDILVRPGEPSLVKLVPRQPTSCLAAKG